MKGLSARFVACLLAATPLVAGAAPQRGPSVAEVLGRVRAAVRYDAFRGSPSGFVGEGTARLNGVEAPYTLAFAPDGRFTSRVAGRLGDATGFDGTRAWTVDWSGMPRDVELEDFDEERFAGWIYTGRWLAEDGPFDVALLDEESDEKKIALRLSLKSGRLQAKMLVDRATWLPAVVVRNSDGADEVYRFERYADVAGIRFPVRVTRSLGDATDWYELRRLARSKGADASVYARPTARPDDTRFRPGVAATVEVRRAVTGHLLVKPLVEGKDVGWFILDSGAGAMVIDAKAAEAAKLPALGEVSVRGVSGSVVSRFRMGESFDLGPVQIRGVRYVELDLAFLTRIFGVPVGGICGYDLFARTVVELNLSAPSVAIRDPKTYELRGATWQEVALSHNHPAVHARFEGDRDGIFKVDTGSDQTVTFHTPAVDRLGLLAGRTTEEGRAGGVGGESTVLSGVMEWFELGGKRFERPTVQFARTTVGAFADEYLVGNIGTGFLSAFKIVFDYPAKRMAFVPI